MADPAAQRAPARGRRGALVAGGLVLASVLLYAVVVALYATSGQVGQIEGEPSDLGDADVGLRVQPQAVDAAGERLTLTIDLGEVSPELSSDMVTLDEDVYVIVSAAAGTRTIEFSAGQVPSPVSVELMTDGFVEQWPFDVHSAVTSLIAYRLVDGEPEALETRATSAGRVPGWNIEAGEVAEGDSAFVEFTASRSGSTVAFGIVLLALMVAMPTLVLIVAISAYRGRRRLEPSFMSWMGAMLFATIPLRGFLPGSPPIGSWIDYLVVLWVIAGLVVGLVVYVAAWLRWSPHAEAPARRR